MLFHSVVLLNKRFDVVDCIVHIMLIVLSYHEHVHVQLHEPLWMHTLKWIGTDLNQFHVETINADSTCSGSVMLRLKKYTMDNKVAIATIYTELTQFNVADTHAVGWLHWDDLHSFRVSWCYAYMYLDVIYMYVVCTCSKAREFVGINCQTSQVTQMVSQRQW